MSPLTLASLEAALAAGRLDSWLAQASSQGLGELGLAQLRRAIALDRRLFAEHPSSLGSCLLARMLAIPELATMRQAWGDELDGRGKPWLRPLRALPMPSGLCAELHADASLNFSQLTRPRFLSDDVVVLTAVHPQQAVEAKDARRRERLYFAWSRGTARLEPDPDADKPDPRKRYPRIETSGWGPAYLCRSPNDPRIQLPCPEEGSADGRFSSDGKRLFVYGTNEEYAGGFVYVLNPKNLAIERKLETGAPVSDVCECVRADRLLVATYRGLMLWDGPELIPLSVQVGPCSLSPSGKYLVTASDGIRIWSISELQNDVPPTRGGFEACFDPSGTRLLSGSRLYEGRSGQKIADLSLQFGGYLEGGPPRPWMHFGERYLVTLHGGLRAWHTHDGTELSVGNQLCLPHWYRMAYDRSGAQLATLHEQHREVKLYRLPTGAETSTLQFKLEGMVLAMSADGRMLAVQAVPDIEVRSTSGTLLGTFAHPLPTPDSSRARFDQGTLRFSHDGQRIASFCPGDGWRIWTLPGGREEHLTERSALGRVADFAAPHPNGWDIEAGTRTLFTHKPSGTRIALPVAGPWAVNPGAPRYIASKALHLELCAP